MGDYRMRLTHSKCGFLFTSFLLLYTCISAMELPPKGKEKNLEDDIQIQKIIEKTCFSCGQKTEIKEKAHITVCCRSLLCKQCAHKIKKSSCLFCPDSRVKIVKDDKPIFTIFDAIYRNNVPAVKQFLNRTLINLEGEESKDSNHYTPLVLATQLGHRPIVEALIERGALFDHKVKDYNALHYAASCGQDSIILYFLSHAACYNDMEKQKLTDELRKDRAKITVDVTNDNNETPLMCACKMSRESTIRLLIGFRADPKRRNKNLENAWDITKKNVSKELVEKMLTLLGPDPELLSGEDNP